MIRTIEFIMQDTVDLEEFENGINEMCAKVNGILHYTILEEENQ